MSYPKVADTYLIVEDMDRAVDFYEAFLGVEAEYRYEDRWTSITDRLGLYNPAYDVEHGVPMSAYDREVRMGNNVMVVFSTDDVDQERARLKSLGAMGITEVYEVNLIAPYRFFHFKDTEGNILEVGKMG